MTEAEITQKIEGLKQILNDDPYLGKKFDTWREKKNARNQSRFSKVSGTLELFHLKQLLNQVQASNVWVAAPSNEDLEVLNDALEAMGKDHQTTQNARLGLALLTEALEAASA